MITNVFQTYSVNQAVQVTQAAVKPVEKVAPADEKNKQQQQSNQTSLDSLGQGRLV